MAQSQDNLQLFNQLPPSLKEALLSDNLNQTIEDALFLIKAKEDKKDYYYKKIFDLVTDILLLKKYYQNFKLELKLQIPDLSEQQLSIIDSVINQKIFEPVKNELETIKQQEIIDEKLQQLKSQNEKKMPPVASNTKDKQLKNVETKLVKENPTFVQKAEPSTIKSEPSIIKNEPTKIIPEIPEIPEIKIKRPINQVQDLKKIEVPNVTPEEQEKIRNRLLEAISKKETKHKIVDTLKEVIESGVKTEIKKPKKEPPIQIPQETTSEVISGASETEPLTGQNTSEKLFGVKIKEETLEPKEKSIPKISEPIKYDQQKETNPFGEA